MIAPPVTYSIDGDQYVAILTGYGGIAGLIGRVVPDYYRQSGQLLVFKLGGTARQDMTASLSSGEIDVTGLTSSGDPDAGMAEYNRTCMACHGANASVAYTADLRRSAALASPEAWKSVVIDGLLKDLGMVSFAEILTPQDAEDIRAYVLRQAMKAQAK